MAKPGPTNSICDVSGVKVGSATDETVRTGTTVILPDKRVVAAVDVRGGGPATRETDALDATCLVDEADAIVLSGGSVYGLEASSGVTTALGQRGRGYPLPGLEQVAPIVPAANLFDLANGGDKSWGDNPPYHQLGRQALENVSASMERGNVGAGRGATIGPYKGGLDTASVVTDDGMVVGALTAANAFGSPVIPGTDTLWAFPLEMNDELGGQKVPAAVSFDPDLLPAGALSAEPGTNTTLAVVATNVALSPAQAKRIAIMAHDGFARAVRPIHTPFDGDVIFVLSLADKTLDDPFAYSICRLGSLAADCVARAVARAAYHATAIDGYPSYRSTHLSA